jgi:uncharacterized protein YbjT (DUF2867 family)
MSQTSNKIILVTGATGKQGGAVVKHLVEANVKVRALTRKPDSKRAEALRQLGVEVVKGNLNDLVSLDHAVKGVYGVFAVTNFWEFGTGKKEVIQNRNLTDLAKKHGIQHYVFASISRCDDHPNLAHFATKYESEKYIKSTGIPYTFLRAVYFMDNLKTGDEGSSFHWAVLRSTLGKDTSLQMISTDDIGWFASNSFLNPEQFLNKTLDIAGDEVTYPKLLAAYKSVFNAEPKESNMAKFFLLNLMPEIKKMFVWYRNPVFKSDINYFKTLYPKLKSIEDYFNEIKNG